MRILGINGIKNDGTDNTDLMLEKLRLVLPDADCIDANYPVLKYIVQARGKRRQRKDARFLIQRYYKEGANVVAHSRGCLINMRMMEAGAKFNTVFWFRPAMNQDFSIPPFGCKRLFVIHRPDDRAIHLGSLLFYHDFGNAGRFGLEVADHYHLYHDPRVRNIGAPTYKKTEFWRHSDDFISPNIERWVTFIKDELSR